ncbi:olfactory receptor 1E16-like [Lissotriton helveticus]
MDNHTIMDTFVLVGLSSNPKHDSFLCVLFFIMYSTTLIGNVAIISVIIRSHQLHTPMYFFLCTLSMVDLCLSTATVPKLLFNLFSGQKTISFYGCFIQMYFFLSAGVMDGFLLAVMALDRYLAICDPMHYTIIMSWRLCALLVSGSWVIVSLHALMHTVMSARLSFCRSNVIHHFFCDVPPMLKLSCSTTFANEMIIFTEGSFIIMGPMIVILISYVRIISTVLKIQSSKGRNKAFSTCTSHLTAVGLFYGAILFMYFRPSSSYSLEYDKAISVIYTVVTPMLNPFIYSLRNKEVKGALRKTWSHRKLVTTGQAGLNLCPRNPPLADLRIRDSSDPDSDGDGKMGYQDEGPYNPQNGRRNIRQPFLGQRSARRGCQRVRFQNQSRGPYQNHQYPQEPHQYLETRSKQYWRQGM